LIKDLCGGAKDNVEPGAAVPKRARGRTKNDILNCLNDPRSAHVEESKGGSGGGGGGGGRGGRGGGGSSGGDGAILRLDEDGIDTSSSLSSFIGPSTKRVAKLLLQRSAHLTETAAGNEATTGASRQPQSKRQQKIVVLSEQGKTVT